MIGDLTERRPVRARGDIFRATARATHVNADFRHPESRAKPGDQGRQGDNGVMAAAVAPAEDIDGFAGQIAQRRRAPRIVLFGKQGAFDAAHNRSPVPLIPCREIRT